MPVGSQAWPGTATSAAAAGRCTGRDRQQRAPVARLVRRRSVGRPRRRRGGRRCRRRSRSRAPRRPRAATSASCVAVALGQAADRDHLLAGVGGGEQRVDRVLLGGVDEPAGVHHHDVGVVGSSVSAQPPAPSRPASSSESTSLRAQPSVTSATLRERVRARQQVTRAAHPSRACVDSPRRHRARASVARCIRRRSPRPHAATCRRSRRSSTSTPVRAASCSPRNWSRSTRTCRTSGSPSSTATVVGCGALHVLWADLGEIRTLAVHPDHRGHRHRRASCSRR